MSQIQSLSYGPKQSRCLVYRQMLWVCACRAVCVQDTRRYTVNEQTFVPLREVSITMKGGNDHKKTFPTTKIVAGL
jgi:hypothetical protein